MNEPMFYAGLALMVSGSGSIAFLVLSDMKGTLDLRRSVVKRYAWIAYAVVWVGIILAAMGTVTS